MKSITIEISISEENENNLDYIVQVVKEVGEKVSQEIENGSTGKRYMNLEGDESTDIYFQCYE